MAQVARLEMNQGDKVKVTLKAKLKGDQVSRSEMAHAT